MSLGLESPSLPRSRHPAIRRASWNPDAESVAGRAAVRQPRKGELMTMAMMMMMMIMLPPASCVNLEASHLSRLSLSSSCLPPPLPGPEEDNSLFGSSNNFIRQDNDQNEMYITYSFIFYRILELNRIVIMSRKVKTSLLILMTGKILKRPTELENTSLKTSRLLAKIFFNPFVNSNNSKFE